MAMTIITTAFAALAAFASTTDGGQTLGATEIAAHVERTVSGRLKAMGSTAVVERIDGVRAQTLPPGRTEIEVDAFAGRWPRKQAAVPVRLSVDGRHVLAMTVRVVLKDERTVPTYAESMPARRPASDLRLTMRTVDMLCCDGSGVSAQDDLTGLRMRRAVRAGQPAMRNDFEPAPEVAARDRVEIGVTRGPVHIATVGIALADARLGERVEIRPEHSDAVIAARVIAKRKVMVDAAAY